MKAWITVLALVAVVGMSGLADAKGAGKHKAKGGIHGKIESVSNGSFVMTTGGKKNPHSVTVNVTTTTLVAGEGVVDGKISSSLIGKRVTVEGTASADIISATKVTIGGGHHHKKKAA